MNLLFPSRIARLSYFLRNVVIVALAVMLAPALASPAGSPGSAAEILWGVLLAIYWLAFVVVPRCRDSGLSPWAAGLMLVPGLMIFVGGYLTWKRSWPVMFSGPHLSGVVGLQSSPGASQNGRRTEETPKSDSLRKLEALRDEGVLTEHDFLRRKARLDQPNDW
jgi:uncharacterized membrane protein YhaH (DUF805 family)